MDHRVSKRLAGKIGRVQRDIVGSGDAIKESLDSTIIGNMLRNNVAQRHAGGLEWKRSDEI